jgi:hypothetical protein
MGRKLDAMSGRVCFSTLVFFADVDERHDEPEVQTLRIEQ